MKLWNKEKRVDLEPKLDELEKRIRELEARTKPEDIYAPGVWDRPLCGCFPRPTVSISLWDMINAIRRHLGLDIEATEAKSATFNFVKKK